MQFEEQTRQSAESGNETKSPTNNTSIKVSPSRRIDTITVLATSPTGSIFSYGTEWGTVHLFDLHQDRVFDTITPKGLLSIEQMSWSDDGKCLCFSDIGKRVFVISVTIDESAPESVVGTKTEISVKNITKGPITQLLFRPNSSCLLVFTSNTVHSISLTSFSVVHSAELTIVECKWIVHPQDSELIIGFNSQHAVIMDWSLVEKQVYTIQPMSSSEALKVDEVIVAQNKRHILVQKSSRDRKTKERALHYFETSKFSMPPEMRPGVEQINQSGLILPASIPQEMTSEIFLPLSFHSNDRLIFLSENYSICSWQIPSDGFVSITEEPHSSIDTGVSPASSRQQTIITLEKGVEELFSLPGDWISRDCLSLCVIWGKEGAFLCPKNGEVAVVRCAALA